MAAIKWHKEEEEGEGEGEREGEGEGEEGGEDMVNYLAHLSWVMDIFFSYLFFPFFACPFTIDL